MEDIQGNLNKGKGLHLAHLNICSLLGKYKADLNKKQIEESGFDIFSLSETWLTQAIPNTLIELQNYRVERWDRSWNTNQSGYPKRGGGLLCYIRKGIKFSG